MAIIFDHDTLNGFPIIIRPSEPEAKPEQLIEWLSSDENELPQLLLNYGAILFRDFKISELEQFEAICKTATPGLVEYTGGGSPRSHVQGNIYTSTEYPSSLPIPLHCEATYFLEPPKYIWLHCVTPPTAGGETPIGDMHQVLKNLDSELVTQFKENKVRYLYNLHNGDGFGRGWKETFATDKPEEVEQWLAVHASAWQWKNDGTLHAEFLAPGLRQHSDSGLDIWGNQAVNWHINQFPTKYANLIKRLYQSEFNYPKHALFGDGSPIPDESIQHIKDVLENAEVAFAWQQGDILLCDNQKISHGRRTFQGERRILVALA